MFYFYYELLALLLVLRHAVGPRSLLYAGLVTIFGIALELMLQYLFSNRDYC